MTPQRVELINTGSELLLGNVRDAHLEWFGKELIGIGLRISRQTTVPDGSDIVSALREAFKRCDVILVTGGLGPTTDDITRELASESLCLPLIKDQEVLRRIQDYCHVRGISFQPRMERQAMVPSGARVLPNEFGTAPGLYVAPTVVTSLTIPHLFLLPGPPRELRPMATNYVIPILKGLAKSGAKDVCNIYRIVGMGESMLESKLGLELSKRTGLEVGYCARPNEVDLRLIGTPSLLDEIKPIVLQAVGDNLLSDAGESMEEVVVRLLQKYGETIATAESCTGGHIADLMTNVPGASSVFREGFVTYSNASKIRILEVPSAVITQHGAVSEEVVRAMAEGACRLSGADYSIATSGIAGPYGGSDEKPVGTVWIALCSAEERTETWKETFRGDRITFKQMVAQSALDRLRRLLIARPA